MRDGSADFREVPEWVGGPTKRSGTSRETLGEVRDELGWRGMGQGTLMEVWDELGTLGEVRVVSADPWGGPGPIKGPSGRSETGRVTLGAVRNESMGSLEGPGRFGDLRGCSGRVGGPSGRFGTDWGSLGVARDALGDPRGGSEQVGGLLRRFRRGR